MKTIRSKSESLFARAFEVTGTQRADLDNLFPVVFCKGAGCLVYDLDGNEYIDFTGASGAINLGYSYDPVDRAVAEYQREGGNIFITKISLARVELAEKLIRLFPNHNYVGFHKTGSCATSVAARYAKLHSGGDIVLSAGYHGWHDWHLNMFEKFRIKDENHLNFGYNLDLLEDLLEKYGTRVACVIITPEPHFFPLNYFTELEEIVRSKNVLLVFDEVASGFRYQLGGFQRYCGVTPDMTVLGKGLANGYAIAAVLGNRDLMTASAMCAHTWSTFDSEISPMIASLATLREFESKGVLAHMATMGQRLREGLEKIFSEFGVVHRITEYPAIFHIIFDDEALYDAWIMEGLARGVVLSRYDYQLISYSHKAEHIDQTLEILRAALEACKVRFPSSFGLSNCDISHETMARRTQHEFGGTTVYRGSRK